MQQIQSVPGVWLIFLTISLSSAECVQYRYFNGIAQRALVIFMKFLPLVITSSKNFIKILTSVGMGAAKSNETR